jgi:hypothetical protein
VADSIAPQIVTGAFTIGGIALTVGVTALQRWRSNKREDRVRFHAERVSAAVDLATAAERYRRALLALHTVISASNDKVSGLAGWNEEQQQSFEDYHRAISRFTLLFPVDVRSRVPALSQALDRLRNVASHPDAHVDEASAAARLATDDLLAACRGAIGIAERSERSRADTRQASQN